MKEEELKICVFLNVKHGYEVIAEVDSWYCRDSGYVRVSEPVLIKFVQRGEEEVVLEKVKSLDREIEGIMGEALKEIEGLKERKAELLALGGAVVKIFDRK